MSNIIGFLIVSSIIHNPIPINNITLISFTICLDIIENITLPTSIENPEKRNDIINKAKLDNLLIVVFRIPYVMPIPKESMLTDTASINIAKNKCLTSKYNM